MIWTGGKDMDYVKTGQLIAKKREEKSLSRQQLADQIHVTAQAVYNWENGIRFPDVNLFQLLFSTLGITPDELIQGEEIADEQLKKGIDDWMKNGNRAPSIVSYTDVKGNEVTIDLREFMLVAVDENGELTDRLIPYEEYKDSVDW